MRLRMVGLSAWRTSKNVGGGIEQALERVYLHSHSTIHSLSKNLMTVCFGQEYQPVNVSCADIVPVRFRLTAAHSDSINIVREAEA